MGPKYDFLRHFPFEKAREEQITAIDFALDALDNQNKTFVILEMGLGCGKSATGVTIARYLTQHRKVFGSESDPKPGAYVLTVQKILQDQYMDDFGTPEHGMTSIKSSANYSCKFFPQQSCAESLRLLKTVGKTLKDTPFEKTCGGNCTYKCEKNSFVTGQLGVTNFAYFLAETMYAGQLEQRDVLIIDECHNLEAELGKFIELSISANFATTVLGLEVPEITGSKALYDWLKTDYLDALSKHVKELGSQLGTKVGKVKKKKVEHINDPALATLTKRYETLDKHMCKLNRFIAAFSEKNWVVTFGEDTNGHQKFVMKPIDVAPFSHEHLFMWGKKVVLMSATVLDKDTFCKSVGIPLDDVAYIRLDSPFEATNRPVHYIPAGRMSANEIDRTLPAIVEAVKEILKAHPNDKGIIHCIDEHTQVLMADGSQKKISSISPSDHVVTFNEKMQYFESSQVVKTYDNGFRECIELEFETGDKLICTADHLILTKNRGWIAANELIETDDIIEYVTTRPSSIVTSW
jgi:ATP-dependent DNA helicase DinG